MSNSEVGRSTTFMGRINEKEQIHEQEYSQNQEYIHDQE